MLEVYSIETKTMMKELVTGKIGIYEKNTKSIWKKKLQTRKCLEIITCVSSEARHKFRFAPWFFFIFFYFLICDT